MSSRPTYRLYIDESGDHTYGKKQKVPFSMKSGGETVILGEFDHYPQLEKDDKRYLGLTGCIFNLEYYRDEFIPKLGSFKRVFFDPDEQVIFHAKDIIQRRGHFHILQNDDTANKFNDGLIVMVAETEYSIINVVIDKKNHIENYGKFAWHPYHYCLANMIDRYCMFLMRQRARGDVMAESRGKTEDFELRNAYSLLYEKGTRFKSESFYQQYLTSKEIKIKPKEKNVAGLQLSDILAQPLKKYTLLRHKILEDPEEALFWPRIVEAAKSKLDCRNTDKCFDGYGLVFIK